MWAELLSKFIPIIPNYSQVKDKVDQVHGLLAGTKTSVDHLLPKSEELLSQTQRQERAISNIHNDLKEKTREIMKELSDVERELGVVKVSDKPLKPRKIRPYQESPPELRPKPNSTAMLPLALPLIDTSSEMEEMENSNTTKGPSVVFPSIENKPIVVNSSFTYQYGKNKFGVEVKKRRKSLLLLTRNP